MFKQTGLALIRVLQMTKPEISDPGPASRVLRSDSYPLVRTHEGLARGGAGPKGHGCVSTLRVVLAQSKSGMLFIACLLYSLWEILHKRK